jgi:hypothetical protein
MDILKSLEGKGIGYRMERQFRIPLLMDREKPVDSEKASTILVQGTPEERARLKVAGKNFVPVPLSSTEDVMELAAFQGAGRIEDLSHPDLASFLKDCENKGLSFLGRDLKPVGAYGAYNIIVDGRSGIWLEKDGFLLAHQQGGRDPAGIALELQGALSTLGEIDSARGDREWYGILKKPLGTAPLQVRREVLGILDKDLGLQKGQDVYNRIADVMRPGEDPRTLVEEYRRMNSACGSSLDHLGRIHLFNYTSAHPDLSRQNKDFLYKSVGQTRDLSAGIAFFETVMRPVREETLADRRDIASCMLSVAGEHSLSRYREAIESLKPEEKFADFGRDYAAALEGTGNYRDNRKEMESALEAMRALKDTPEEHLLYREIFRRTGISKRARAVLEEAIKPIRGESLKERASAFISILEVSDNRRDYHCAENALSLHKEAAKSLKEAENFRAPWDLMRLILTDLKGAENQAAQASEAFAFVRANLDENEAGRECFRALLAMGKSTEFAKMCLPAVLAERKGETRKEREEALRDLLGEPRSPRYAATAWAAIMESLGEGEKTGDNVRWFKELHEIKGSRAGADEEAAYFGADEEAAYFLDMKRIFHDDGEGISRFLARAKKIGLLDAAFLAENLLSKPLGESGRKEREEVFQALFDAMGGKGDAVISPIENYRVLAANLDPEETPLQNAERFLVLMKILGGPEQAKEARDGFSFISAEMRKGSFPGKTAREVTEELEKKILMGCTLEEAKSRLFLEATKPEISEDGASVVVGGVRLQVQKKDGSPKAENN